MNPQRAAWALVLVVAGSTCTWWGAASSAASPAAAASVQMLDRLYFGRAQPDGTEVSEQAWAEFLRDVVTPRFPHGLTVFAGHGQWRDAQGRVDSERSFMIELVHADTALDTADVRAIIAAYKQRFRQESVLWLRHAVQATF